MSARDTNRHAKPHFVVSATVYGTYSPFVAVARYFSPGGIVGGLRCSVRKDTAKVLNDPLCSLSQRDAW
jgi:hypothetical protein